MFNISRKHGGNAAMRVSGFKRLKKITENSGPHRQRGIDGHFALFALTAARSLRFRQQIERNICIWIQNVWNPPQPSFPQTWNQPNRNWHNVWGGFTCKPLSSSVVEDANHVKSQYTSQNCNCANLRRCTWGYCFQSSPRHMSKTMTRNSEKWWLLNNLAYFNEWWLMTIDNKNDEKG